MERKEITRRIVDYLEGREREILDFACQLIATPSPNPPGDERQVAEVVLKKLAALGLQGAEVKAKKTERPNILLRLPGKEDEPVLLYNGHLDTKPAGDLTRWNTDPLKPTLVDGRLYGLGAGDMKGAIAAMIYAAAALRATDVELDGDLLLVFSADEEGGSDYGAKYLVEEGIKADAALLGEPCGINEEWEYLTLISRGITCFKIKVTGTQTHSSISDILPTVNASEKMALVLSRMKKGLQLTYDPHPLCPQGPTVNPGVMVWGGIYYGVYPGEAGFSTDIRTLPGMTLEGVRRDIEKFLDDLRDEDPELQLELQFEPTALGWIQATEIPPDHSLVRALLNASETALGFRPPLGACPGTTDAAWFQGLAGIPTVPAFGPGRITLAHTPNEYIAVDSLLRAAKLYALAAIEFLG